MSLRFAVIITDLVRRLLSAGARRAGDSRGATMVEYALLVALVGVALIVAWRLLGDAVDASGRSSASRVSSAV